MNKVEDSGGMVALDVEAEDSPPLPDTSAVADQLEDLGLTLAYMVAPESTTMRTVVYIDPATPVAAGHSPDLLLVELNPGQDLADVILPDPLT